MISTPLADIRVVEYAEAVAGPLMGRLLGDAGADVIKVEPPEGDRARTWGPGSANDTDAFRTLNRNKRSIALEPSTSRDLAELAELADVLIVDQQLGDRAGLDLPGLMASTPTLVVCSISAWGPEGPWARRVGAELPVQLSTETTTSLGRPGEEPVRLGIEHAGTACALYGFQAVTAALLVAENGGQRIDVSLFGALIHMRTAMWIAQSNPDDWYGFHLDSYMKPPEHFYTCSDRRVLFQINRVDDLVDLVKDLKMDFVLTDPRWAMFREDSGALGRYAHLVHDIWDRGLSQWTFAEAEDIFKRHGVTIIPCLTHDEFLQDPQVEHLGIVTDDGHFRPPWQMSSTPASVRRGAPLLDEHGAEIRQTVISQRQWLPTS